MKAKSIIRWMIILAILTGMISACNLPVAGPSPEEVQSHRPTLTPMPAVTTAPIRTLTPTITSSPTETSIPHVPENIDTFLARCPTAEEIASIDADIRLVFESDPTVGTLACTRADGSANLTPLQRGAYQALSLMKNLEFDQPLPWTDKSLYEWLINAIDGVRFRSDIENGFCCEPANIINVSTAGYAHLSQKEITQWMDPQSGWGLVWSLMIIMAHEARHNEGYPHTCAAGPTMDNTIAELGANGVVYSLNTWLAYHTEPGFFYTNTPPDYYREQMAYAAASLRQVGFCLEPTVTPGPPPPLP
ncbi:hypothetical protein GW866_05135 [bacterium]|nr:hypothetical protein [bacterium]OIO85488.1 MAG: hypothetical protein AUK02_06540 [Anaerolineae bacterium CG2_30_58_95]